MSKGLNATISPEKAEAREALVFTRWMNGYLIRTKHSIVEGTLLTGALDDGSVLWFFLTTLSGKKLPPLETGKQAATKLAHTQNLNACLSFLQSEGIKLMNIGAQDIQNRKANLILGMIWTIFLRYQMRGQTSVRDAKRATVEWLQDELGLDVADLTNSFEDGHNYIHLVNALTDNIIDEKLISDDPKKNAELALTVAQHTLGIPKLVNAEDLVGEGIDEKILLVFLSSFMDLQRKVNSTGFGWVVLNSIPANYQPKQLETCVSVNLVAFKPIKFHIKTNNVQSIKQLLVKTTDPFNDDAQVSSSFTKSDVGGAPDSKYHTWGVSVTPMKTGPMEIYVSIAAEGLDDEGREIPPSMCGGIPLKAKVEEGPSDYLYVPNKTCVATRPCRAEVMSDFTILCKYEDGTSVSFDMAPFIITFVPPKPGKVTLSLTREGRAVDGSPAIIQVLDAPKLAWALPPGASSNVFLGQDFIVNLQGATIHPEDFVIKVKDSTGKPVDFTISKTVLDSDQFSCKITPDSLGSYVLEAYSQGSPVPQSFPFEVKAKPSVTIGALPTITQDEPCKIQFRTKHMDASGLKVSVKGPDGSDIPVKITKGSEGKVVAEFKPPAEGNIVISAVAPECAPLTVNTQVKPVPSVKLKDSDNLDAGRVNSPYDLVFDAVNLSASDLAVTVLDEKKKNLPVSLLPLGDGSQWVAQFTPETVGKHTVAVAVKGKPASGSPFFVNVSDKPTAKAVSVPKKTVTGKPLVIELDTNIASLDSGELKVLLELNGQPLTFDYDKGKIKCQPECLGRLVFSAKLDGNHIQGSPANIEVAPGASVTLIGSPDRQVALGKVFSFSLDTNHVTDLNSQIKVFATSPSGKAIPISVLEHTSYNNRAQGRPSTASPASKPSGREKSISSPREKGASSPKSSSSLVSDRKELSRQVSHRPRTVNETTWVATFTPTEEGKHPISVKLEGKEVATINLLVLSTAAGKISGMEGEVMVGQSCICLFDLIDVKPEDIDVHITYADGSVSQEKIEPHDQSFAMKFVPSVEGDAKVEAKIRGKQLMGSPMTFEVFPIPWVKIDIDTSQRRAFLNEQFFFQIVSSINVKPSDLFVRATDLTTKEAAEFNPVSGRRAKAFSTTSVAPAGTKVLYYDCYWMTTCSTPTQVKTEIQLNGVDAPGTPFLMPVEAEHALFQKTLPWAQLVEKSPMPVDNDKGIEMVISWQTKTTRKVPLSFSVALFSDLGERLDVVSPGQGSSTNEAIQVTKLDHGDGNSESLYINPSMLRCDTKVIPIFVVATALDFSHVNKFVFSVNKTKGKLTTPGYVTQAPRKETAVLIGFVAKDNDVWQFHVEGKFSFSRFITDLLPLNVKQINKWAPYQPSSGNQPLRRARSFPIHPNVEKLEMDIACNWKSRLDSKSASMRNLGVVVLTVTVLAYKFNETKPYIINDGDPSLFGITNDYNGSGKCLVEATRIPDDVQTFVLVGTQAIGAKETGLASLESCVVKLRGNNKAPEKPGVTVSPFSSAYELAHFTATRDEIGAVASMVILKLTKRSPEAPWEFIPIGAGAAETTIDEMIFPRKGGANQAWPGKADDLNAKNVGLEPYLQKFWRPSPTSLRVYVLSAYGLPADKSGNCNPFVQFHAIPKMNYENFEKHSTAAAKNTTNPIWGECFEFKRILNHARKDLAILATIWDQSSGNPVFLGEFKVPLKKFFNDAMKTPMRAGEGSFKLEKSSSKSFKTTRSVTGEVRLRYICF